MKLLFKLEEKNIEVLHYTLHAQVTDKVNFAAVNPLNESKIDFDLYFICISFIFLFLYKYLYWILNSGFTYLREGFQYRISMINLQ